MFRTLWIQVWFYYCKNKKIKMYAWYTFIRHIRWTTNIECLAYNCVMGKSTLAVETCVHNREIQNIIEWVYWKESKEVANVSVLWLWLTNHWMTGFLFLAWAENFLSATKSRSTVVFTCPFIRRVSLRLSVVVKQSEHEAGCNSYCTPTHLRDMMFMHIDNFTFTSFMALFLVCLFYCCAVFWLLSLY